MNKQIFLLLTLTVFVINNTMAQSYIGAGNNNGINVYTSDQHNDTDWQGQASAINTINGSGLDAKYMEASRFLAHATLGYEKQHIDNVLDIGIEDWIDNQIQMPVSEVLPMLYTTWQMAKDTMVFYGENPDDFAFRPNWVYFNYAWWEIIMKNEDLLRHRVAEALSQIFVVSKNSDLSEYGDGLASYYDVLAKNALGNYKDLLTDVTLHPTMGFYLSHLNNPKSDAANNQHPDENYAREVMQLFSIGLYELNPDGSRILDANGNAIPTYGQPEIKEFAKIFTGLGVADTIANPYQHDPVYFGRDIWTADVTLPMIMYNYEHEPGPKTLLNGTTLPDGQSGMKDIEDAIDNLFNHPNVGPFIGYRLIQRLVKSNPSPAYVQRVTNAFNNNGAGVRGDLGAVVKAILMDSEARTCGPQSDQSASRLREPLIRYTQFARGVDKFNPNNLFWNVGYGFYDGTHQDILHAPSVFNFYVYDHAPVGPIASANLVAPEFNLHDTRTAVGYMNSVSNWNSWWGRIMQIWEEHWVDGQVTFDITYYKELAKDPEALINEVDKVFAHGQLSDHTKSVMRYTMDQLPIVSWDDHLDHRVYLTMYILMVSPDYAVMR